MGTKASTETGVASALFTPVQGRVLGLLFGQPERRFQSAELIRLANGGTGAVHRQLSRLETAGLVSVMRSGNQKHYQANPNSPVFTELQGLVVKTVGLAGPLRQALASVSKQVRAAFVYGSIAKGTDRAGSDVDLMVVSDTVGYHDVFRLLEGAEAALSRKINPTVLTVSEWRSKRARSNSFAERVATQPRIFVLGSDDELG